MFLKNLEIKGFKSFADSALLPLQPGVAVVVGPNGAGKSNVVDAIGWVLGAQAPSTVRSQKMDDVIFAGTSKRPALGRAEVSLTIDNSSGMLPIDFTEVTLSRLLFRSGDSEYSINGVPCRLLDIQELLSDSGVGRQQHVIVSQGNIDAVLNARPEDRRLIVEEAAGVLKFRRRKERAERRLSSTEANLTRVQDLLRELRRQLRPLERQADAARRHGALVEELRALEVFLAGRELARLQLQLQASSEKQRDHQQSSQSLKLKLGQLDSNVLAAEAELTGLGETEVSENLSRYETLRERCRGLVALVTEQHRGLTRELEATVDAAVVSSLEAERAQLQTERTQITHDLTLLEKFDSELQVSESALSRDWSNFDDDWGDGIPAANGEAAALRSEKGAIESAHQRGVGDRDQLARRTDALSQRISRLDTALRESEARRTEGVSSLPALSETAERFAAELDRSELALTESEGVAAAAAADQSGWIARVDALTMALDEARNRAGAKRLADVHGVLGTLMDLVEIDPGWEDAFEAAAGAALGAVVVASTDDARKALKLLADGEGRGAVIALGASRSAVDRPPSRGGPRIRDHVRATTSEPAAEQIDALLDSLLVNTEVVDGSWEQALERVVEEPAMNVVTTQGHRFGAEGWRLRATGTGATGAALDDATQRANRSEVEAEQAKNALLETRKWRDSLRVSAEESRKLVEATTAAINRHEEAVDRLGAERSEVVEQLGDLDELVKRIDARLVTEADRLRSVMEKLPLLEEAEKELGARGQAMAQQRSELESQTGELRAKRTESDLRKTSVSERRRFIDDRLEHIEIRLDGLVVDTAAAAENRAVLEARLQATDHLASFLRSRSAVIDVAHSEARQLRRSQSEAAREISDRLGELRAAQKESGASLEELRELAQRTEVDHAEIRVRLEAATETVRAELDLAPAEAIAAVAPETPEGATPAGRARDLRSELKRMGQINPLALTEFEEHSERQTFLTSQLDDIKATRRELSKVIRAVDTEIVQVFTAAFADVSENFAHLFETLFPGGRGRLRLTNPDDLLNTGIEVEAKPSGKNVRKLSLLSGGERSLTALAYLFAVFRARPSPFYVMDEVEAALDDVNLHRFLELIGEFRSTAQLIIVSHQKRTMEAADVLFGVSMDPGGSSKIVSEQAQDVIDVRAGSEV